MALRLNAREVPHDATAGWSDRDRNRGGLRRPRLGQRARHGGPVRAGGRHRSRRRQASLVARRDAGSSRGSGHPHCSACVRCDQRRGGGRHGAHLQGTLRTHRHPHQQCRRLGGRRTSRLGRRGVGCTGRSQPEKRVPYLQARAARDGGAAPRCDRQRVLHLRPALERGRAGGLRGHQSRRDPVLARGGGAVCQGRHPRQHGGAGPAPHADG